MMPPPLRHELALQLRDALDACGELARAIGDDSQGHEIVTHVHAEQAAAGLERSAARIRASVAQSRTRVEQSANNG